MDIALPSRLAMRTVGLKRLFCFDSEDAQTVAFKFINARTKK